MAAIVESAPQPLNAEALFDSVGPAYEDAFSTCTPQRESLRWLLSQLPRSSHVLDIGCGTGRPVCSDLAAAGHNVHGIDVSGAMIDAARNNVPNAKFTKVDIADFSPETSYDAVTVYFSMIASVTPAQIKEYIGRIYTWVKPGGYFVFATVPIAGENMEIKWMGRPIVASSLDADDVVNTIREKGFEVLERKESMFMPKAVEAGICEKDEVWEEPHVFVYARKP